ncbi:hypothetical protein IAT40_000791 [Kwoniella sp. CBS 6097]
MSSPPAAGLAASGSPTTPTPTAATATATTATTRAASATSPSTTTSNSNKPAEVNTSTPSALSGSAAEAEAEAEAEADATAPAVPQAESESTTYAPPQHPPPTTTQPQPQSQSHQQQNQTITQQPQPPSNPKVAELRQIFPNVELSVIELVLETCGGSTDRAIEQLLGMTDPDFRPDELGGTREDHQVDLDAEFARSLQMADEEEYNQSRSHSHSRPPPPSAAFGGGGGAGGNVGLGSGELPYQPRVRRARGAVPGGAIAGGQSALTGAIRNDEFYAPTDAQGRFDRYNDPASEGNPPGMLAFEEKVEKFAEAGKQTFNSLLSRAKAKYSEFQVQQAQNRANQQGNGGGYQPENLSPSGDRYTRPPSVGGGRGGEQNRGGLSAGGGGGLWGDTRSPSVRSESISSESTYDAPPVQTTAPIRQSSHRWQPSDAYDDPLPAQRSMSGSSNRIEVMGGSGSGRRSPSARFGSPEKATGKIDPAKLGILPKKRVDLMSTSPSNTSTLDKSKQQPPGHIKVNDDDDDDPNPSLPNAPHNLVSKIPPTPPATDERYSLGDSDDELEYTKNPFDEK